MEMNLIQKLLRDNKCQKEKARLTNHSPSIIANNCIAGFIYHDFSLPFASPTINLWIDSEDYMTFLERFAFFMNQELVDNPLEAYEYPVGDLDGINILFQHYHSFREAKEIWDRRAKRVDLNNLFIIFVQREDTTEDHVQRFLQLPFVNKIYLTNQTVEIHPNLFYIEGFEDHPVIGQVNEHYHKFSGKRYYDQFDWVTWLNEGINKQ